MTEGARYSPKCVEELVVGITEYLSREGANALDSIEALGACVRYSALLVMEHNGGALPDIEACAAGPAGSDIAMFAATSARSISECVFNLGSAVMFAADEIRQAVNK